MKSDETSRTSPAHLMLALGKLREADSEAHAYVLGLLLRGRIPHVQLTKPVDDMVRCLIACPHLPRSNPIHVHHHLNAVQYSH